jgi:cytochrome c-type biogenesis protein CcmH/NrfG
MVKSFGSTLTALGLIGALSACTNPGAQGPRSASIFGEKVDTSNIGVATRAQAALEEGNTAAAVHLAERAVAGSPNDAGFRSLLANTYFASGRFASAEAAYKDSLSLLPNQPQLVLKLALVTYRTGQKCRGGGAAGCGPRLSRPLGLRPGPGAGRPAGHRRGGP